jgi:thiol-disulfide isomerase/thioredoxin
LFLYVSILMMFHVLFLVLFFHQSGSSLPPTILVFTGSDWCPNCRRLDAKILSDTAFINFTRDRLLIEFADFPQHKKQDCKTIEKNKALAEKYHFLGIYPTILILDNEGKVKGQILYRNQSTKEFIDQLKEILPK